MIQLSNLELYKSKVTEFLETKLNELEFAADWELIDDPLLVPIYVDSNGKLTLEKQTELRAATQFSDYLHYHKKSQGLLNNITFESLVFPNLESVPSFNAFTSPFFNSLWGCSHIKNLYFPELKNLGTYAMRNLVYNCSNLSTVEFPKLESAGERAFENDFNSCPNLKDVYFPSLISVGRYTFSGCGTVVKLHFKKSLAGNSKFTKSYLGIEGTNQIVFDI